MTVNFGVTRSGGKSSAPSLGSKTIVGYWCVKTVS